MRHTAVFAVVLLGATLAGGKPPGASSRELSVIDIAEFAPGIASTEYSDARLTLSRDGRLALWFSRNRPGGPGNYDIWMSRHSRSGWSAAEPVPFNSPSRDFDPALSRDGRYVYFASDRPGGKGGDDLYRVAVTRGGFGAVEHLGSDVNTSRNEWAPMLAPDGVTLLFSSDGHAGAGRMDLFTATLHESRFGGVRPMFGLVNTEADEFDATFLADGRTLIFSRSADLGTRDVLLYHATLAGREYAAGVALPESINTPGSSTYAPMLDWSRPDTITFTTRRPADSRRAADLYRARFGR